MFKLIPLGEDIELAKVAPCKELEMMNVHGLD